MKINFFIQSFFIAKSHVGNQNKKASMLFLSKEATSKDQQLKTQMLISLKDNESKKTETVWSGNGFFDEERSDLTITKPNFLENTLVCINQGSISNVKGGHAIYLDFVILGQLIPVANPDLQIYLENHQFKDHEACLFVPIYNKATGMYGGLTKKLAHITLRGDVNERFYSYGYNKEKSALLYCVNRHPLPNIFHYTAFKQYHGFYLMKIKKKPEFSKMFLFLPSTLDRKEKFLQWQDHVHLHPVDVSFDELKEFNNGEDFTPDLLDNKELRRNITSLFYNYMKRVAEIANHNIVRNSDAYMAVGGQIDPDNEFCWIVNSYKDGKEKFQLGY